METPSRNGNSNRAAAPTAVVGLYVLARPPGLEGCRAAIAGILVFTSRSSIGISPALPSSTPPLQSVAAASTPRPSGRTPSSTVAQTQEAELITAFPYEPRCAASTSAHESGADIRAASPLQLLPRPTWRQGSRGTPQRRGRGRSPVCAEARAGTGGVPATVQKDVMLREFASGAARAARS